jgi:PAS domain S-box-containing protein
MSKIISDPSLEFLDHVYKNASVGLCYFDAEFGNRHVNEWLAKINGLSVEAHIGRTLRDVDPHVAPEVEEQIRRVLETGEARG